MTTPDARARQRPIGTSHWAVLLAGPVIGTLYFFAVYVLAELSCAGETALLNTRALRIVIVAAAAFSALALMAYAWRARQLWHAGDAVAEPDRADLAQERRDNGRFMVTTGLLLLGMFLLFALFLAAPSLGGALC